MSKWNVAILMGSKSDLPLMQPAATTLRGLGIQCVMRVISAHRTPNKLVEFFVGARERGIRVVICGAGGAAHLAGAAAAQTTLPIIGVPLARTPLAGHDALLATVQMPSGMPVATVAVDGAANAGLLAAQMLAIDDATLTVKLDGLRERRRAKIFADDESVAKL